MKYPLASTAYSFNATAKTITFIGTIPAEISNILHVANITRGVIYFQPQAGLSYSGSYSSPTLTLVADTTGHSNSDKLLVIYDNGADGATAANQVTTNASLSSIDSKTPALVSGRQPVDGSGVTQPVSAASLPLPSGAATAANQATTNASLGNIDADLGAPADAAASTDTGTFSLIALVKRGLTNWTTLLARIPTLVSGRIPVDGSGVTQPVSGTVTATGPLTDTQLRASAVPVAPNVQQGGGVITATTQRVTLASDGPTVSTLTSIDTKTATLVSGRVPVDGSAVTQPVSAASLPLPTGAATAANQTTANTSLAAIAGLSIPAHDYIALSYTGNNLTGVQYRTGGSAGTIVGTLTLAYSGSTLTSVTKS